jgi:RNA polymerase sigma factor (sigma-70 family)
MPIGGDDEPRPEGPSADAVGIEAAYLHHADRLRDLAHRKFRVPHDDAAALVNEVFMAFLLRRELVRNPDRWLVGAVCHASRGYLRNAAKAQPLPNDGVDFVDPVTPDLEKKIVDRVTIAKTLRRLCPKCQKTLRLYYSEGYSAAEIAVQLDTSEGYVTQLLHTCRNRAREIYKRLLLKARSR